MPLTDGRQEGPAAKALEWGKGLSYRGGLNKTQFTGIWFLWRDSGVLRGGPNCSCCRGTSRCWEDGSSLCCVHTRSTALSLIQCMIHHKGWRDQGRWLKNFPYALLKFLVILRLEWGAATDLVIQKTDLRTNTAELSEEDCNSLASTSRTRGSPKRQCKDFQHFSLLDGYKSIK